MIDTRQFETRLLKPQSPPRRNIMRTFCKLDYVFNFVITRGIWDPVLELPPPQNAAQSCQNGSDPFQFSWIWVWDIDTEEASSFKNPHLKLQIALQHDFGFGSCFFLCHCIIANRPTTSTGLFLAQTCAADFLGPVWDSCVHSRDISDSPRELCLMCFGQQFRHSFPGKGFCWSSWCALSWVANGHDLSWVKKWVLFPVQDLFAIQAPKSSSQVN